MPRRKNPTSDMDVAEKMNTPLAQRLNILITDGNALKDFLGCSIQAVNQYKLGISRPSLENLCKIADFYGVSTDYLLGRTDPENSTADEKLKMISEYTGLSNQAILRLDSISTTVAYGKRTLNDLIAHPKFYEFISYMSTYFYGGFVEEFTGVEEGLVSEIKLIKNDSFFKRYIQPSMLSKMFEILTEIRNQIDDRGEK